MPALRSAVREAMWVGCVSLILAVAYNGLNGKGLFDVSSARSSPSHSSSLSSPSSAAIIPIESAKALFDGGNALFIDSRHAYDFDLGHISGAMNIPLKEGAEAVKGLTIDKARTIVVYCDGVECNSSLEVGAAFVSNGYTDVRIFFGGWQSWRSAGYPWEANPK